MSFFGKLKVGNVPYMTLGIRDNTSLTNLTQTPTGQAASNAASKKDAAQGPTPLEKHLKDLVEGGVRPDGSDKFFGFENVCWSTGDDCMDQADSICVQYGSTW